MKKWQQTFYSNQVWKMKTQHYNKQSLHHNNHQEEVKLNQLNQVVMLPMLIPLPKLIHNQMLLPMLMDNNKIINHLIIMKKDQMKNQMVEQELAVVEKDLHCSEHAKCDKKVNLEYK